jgi:uncharacterized protein (DUF697 family)
VKKNNAPSSPRKATNECKSKLATELFAREAHVDPPPGSTLPPLPTSDKNFRRLYADRTVHHWCQWATVAGFVPVPVIDILSISATQAKMVHSLCQIYDKRFEREALASVISGLVGGSLTGLVSATLAFTLIKNIPLVGSTFSALTQPAVAFGATYALGAVLIQHFENDREMSDLSVKEVEQYFLDQFKKGKALFIKKEIAD